MENVLDILRKLQVIDGALYQLRRELREQPLLLEQANHAVAEAQAPAKTIEASIKDLHVQQKQKDLDLTTKETNAKKLQSQLFQVKTNKEYSAIQHEIEQSKADSSLLEEEILKLMERIERLSREHKARLAVAAEEQGKLKLEEARVAEQSAAIQAHISDLEQQRAGVAPNVERDTLTLYERVLAIREGVAMVPLIGDSCSGCHMAQRPQVIHEVHLKAKLVMCESCSRILYLDESAATSGSSIH